MGALRVLYINGGLMHRGGIESYMMNYYRNIDKSKVQFDFVVHGYDKGEYDDEIESMGGKIFNVPIKSKEPFKYKLELKKIFLNNNYKIVHAHLDAMSAWVLKIAKECGVPVRIAHSHNTQHLTTNKIKFVLNEFARKNINKYANYRCACSPDAARWLFGTEDVIYIKNAIDLDKFKFDSAARNEVRSELGIKDELVIGHIGRFDYQKNHEFLINVLKKVTRIIPDVKLLLIGDGSLRKNIEQQISDLGLMNNVILLGVRNDVNIIINAFDVFALPSRFEGLGIVLIEAQANGLNCIASDVIPKEANAGSKVIYLPLDEDKWCNKLIDMNFERYDNTNLIRKRGYDIRTEAIKLCELYQKLSRGV